MPKKKISLVRSYELDVLRRIKVLEGEENFNVYINRIGGVTNEQSSHSIYRLFVKERNKKDSQDKKQTKERENILLSAGLHGEEPAGVYALLDFLEKDIEKYLEKFNFVIYPCINPQGFETNILENANNVDLNSQFGIQSQEPEIRIVEEDLKSIKRDYRVCIDLHECDPKHKKWPQEVWFWESQKTKEKRIGRKVLNKMQTNLPICKWEKIPQGENGEKNQGGVISYPESKSNQRYLDEQSFDAYLLGNYSNHTFTFETPTSYGLEERVKTQLTFVKTVLDLL